MSDRPGFDYFVTDEQLAAFRALTPAQRLRWLEETRELTYRLAPESTRRSWRLLREHPAPPPARS